MLLDLGGVHRKRPLDPDAERQLAYGEGAACARALLLQHDALEHLCAPAGALHDLEVDPNAIADPELGHLPQLTALDALDQLVHG